MKNNLHLKADKLGHRFGNQWLFRSLDFSVKQGETLIVRGKNGSGKSTLLRVAGQLLQPSEGEILFEPTEIHSKINRHFWMGYLSPGLNLYGELSGKENISLALETRGLEETDELLVWMEGVGFTRKDWTKSYKSYSSGMKQRIKFLAACLHHPELLLLDEPFSNLDRQGKNWVRSILPQIQNQSVVLIASNEEEDFDLSPLQINIDDFHNR